MEGELPAATDSVKETSTTDVFLSHDHSRFPKPLFYTLLTGVFVLHIPGIVLSTLIAYESLSLNSTAHPMLSGAVKIILSFPSQTWAVVLHPILVGIACIVRKDGTALWRYHEEPLSPAPTEIVEEKAEQKVQTELLDSDHDITTEIPSKM